MLILHISDIHFRHPECGTEHDPDRPFRTMLANDVRALLPDLGGRVDAIIVTGDIAFRGIEEEFAAAQEWLLRHALEFGCPVANIFVVPGNHDVNRTTCNKAEVRNVQQAIRIAGSPAKMEFELRRQVLDATTGRALLKPIEAFNQFAAKFGCDLFAPEKIYRTHDLPLERGVTLRFHGLNSTMLSGFNGEDDVRPSMFISPRQTILDPIEGVVNAVLSHHPPEWCHDHDDIDDACTTRAQLHFFGHKHRQRIVQADNYVRYFAGAVNPARDEAGWEPGYNLVKLSVAAENEIRLLVVESHVRTLRAGDSYFDYRRPSPGVNTYQKTLRIAGVYRPGETDMITEHRQEPVPVASVASSSADVVKPDTVKDRNLIYRFWNLKLSERREIAFKLELINQEDMKVPEAERYTRALTKAKECGLLERLADEIAIREK